MRPPKFLAAVVDAVVIDGDKITALAAPLVIIAAVWLYVTVATSPADEYLAEVRTAIADIPRANQLPDDTLRELGEAVCLEFDSAAPSSPPMFMVDLAARASSEPPWDTNPDSADLLFEVGTAATTHLCPHWAWTTEESR